jgi:NADH-quinone oxidoreductase subunit N
MNDISQELSIISSELVLILGSMIALVFGACARVNKDVKVLAISFAVLSVSIYIVLNNLFINVEMSVFNNMLISNSFTSYGKLLILISSLSVLIMMIPSKAKGGSGIAFEIPVLLLISTSGMMFLASSNSLISLYMGLEMMSLPLYIMAASDITNSKSSEAGMKYFILGTLASGIFLLGSSVTYGFTGTVDFTRLYQHYPNLNLDGDSVTVPIGFLVGMVLILIALAFKISAVPFHMWTLDVYQGAPTLITTFLASAPKIAGFIILIRILFGPFADLYGQWQQIIVFLSIASMVVGSLGAIMQKNFKRLLAYSSIGHVGFILAGLSTASVEGAESVSIYLTIYIFMIIASFGCLMLLKRDDSAMESIEDFSNLSGSYPYISFAISVLLLSMAGIPPLAGFFIKFYMLIPILKAGMYPLALIFVLSSVIAAFYYLKVIKTMYFNSTDASGKIELLPYFNIKLIVFLGVVINIFYIFVPSFITNISRLVSSVLFG